MSGQYERDGYVVVPSHPASSTIELLHEQCRQFAAAARVEISEGTAYSLAVPGDVDDVAVVSAFETFRPVASRLLEAEVAPTFVLWHAVTATVANGRGWHQALAYHHLLYSPNAVTVPLDELEILVMLDDAVDDDMAPWFAPGHHVLPMLEHRRSVGAQMGFELVDPERQLVLGEAVKMPMRRGDAVAYTLGTPHACVCAHPGTRSEVLFLRLGFRAIS